MACFVGIGGAVGVSGRYKGVCGRRTGVTVRCAEEDAVKPKPAAPRPKPAPQYEDLKAEEEDLVLGFDNAVTEDERHLLRPNDPTEMRTESERRRSSGRKAKNLRRRRRVPVTDDLDWDKMETKPLVRKEADPTSGEDYWIDMTLAPQRRRRPKKPIDGKLKERLKEENLKPYKQNWIGVIVMVVFVLVILYNVLPNETPMIALPDL